MNNFPLYSTSQAMELMNFVYLKNEINEYCISGYLSDCLSPWCLSFGYIDQENLNLYKAKRHGNDLLLPDIIIKFEFFKSEAISLISVRKTYKISVFLPSQIILSEDLLMLPPLEEDLLFFPEVCLPHCSITEAAKQIIYRSG